MQSFKKGVDDLAEDKKIVVENEDGDSAELNSNFASSPEEIKPENNDLNLLAEMEKVKTELLAKNDRLLRLQADFDNFRKRAAKEKVELAAVIEQSFLTDLLPLLDNLARASSAAEGENATVENLRKGIEMIKNDTIAALTKHGLEPIDTKGKMFDPNFHQAVGAVQDETKADGAIAAEFQRGYIARGKVIRPSMVQVVNNS
ncbi:MAG: nucleotide exchange factor GrpE [Selenomonadaceae bacterium]|nr:nucleotide exchange factor GrpE [Selenomonadaceae bacterium]